MGVGVCKAAKDIIQHARVVGMGGYLGRRLTDQRAAVAIGIFEAAKDISEHAQHVVVSLVRM